MLKQLTSTFAESCTMVAEQDRGTPNGDKATRIQFVIQQSMMVLILAKIDTAEALSFTHKLRAFLAAGTFHAGE